MKYYLFVDNFRGFRDTCIPITDVNFLVGQNSTGKTSVLALLKLFSGPRLLMGGDIGDEHVGFGHFADMVSANSSDPSYFRIGFVWERPVKKKGGTTEMVTSGSLFTFLEKDGLPRLFKCTFCRGTEKVSLKIGTTQISYKTDGCTPASNAQDFISTLRTQWVSEHSSPDHGFEKLTVPRGFVGKIPILLALSLIGHADEPAGKGGELVLHTTDIAFAPPDLIWLAPIRTKARRTYDELALAFSPDGQHTPYLVRKLLQSKSEAHKFRDFIDKVGKASGLFQDVRIKNFGRGATARFELDIVIDDKPLNVLNVGYGVSQSLPVIVEILARDRGSWFAIQQPEIHLHPRAQAALGDVLFQMAVVERKRFIVETHSDFTIDRFRMNYRNERSNKPDSQILFFERRDKHNVVTPLAIGNTGELPADQPESYREFFVREQMDILGI